MGLDWTKPAIIAKKGRGQGVLHGLGAHFATLDDDKLSGGLSKLL